MKNKLFEKIVSLTLQGYHIEVRKIAEWDEKFGVLVRKYDGLQWHNSELIIPLDRIRCAKLKNDQEESMVIESINYAVTEIQKLTNEKSRTVGEQTEPIIRKSSSINKQSKNNGY